MSGTIHKYALCVGANHVESFEGVRFLDAQYQPSESSLILWAMVDPDAAPAICAVLVVGTGWSLNDEAISGMTYLATAQQGPLVWHVFVPAASLVEG